jgi:hypothetical protein
MNETQRMSLIFAIMWLALLLYTQLQELTEPLFPPVPAKPCPPG